MSGKRYRVNEIFYSLQGEGRNTGVASVFVRLSGCNLACEFCDTQHQQGTLLTAGEIARQVDQWPQAPLIVLTGGEPTLQADAELTAALHATGKRIAIETNGTHPLPPGIDWVTLSPKTGFAGGETHPVTVGRCDELKVVYLGQDLAAYDHIEAQYRYLQPCFVPDPGQNQRNIAATVQAVLNNPQWQLSLQTHRLLGIQ